MRTSFINDSYTRKTISRSILESLTEWFEIDENREKYIEDSSQWSFFAAFEEEDNNKPVGFLCLKETGPEAVELAVMGVLKQYHRKGVGRCLFEAAKEFAADKGYAFLHVKTVQYGVYKEYDKTNLFYKSLGFKELEVIEEIWGKENPCQIYVMSL